MMNDRRKRLADLLQGGVVVVTAYDALQLSGDMAVPFLQEANFFWLTTVNEPGWKAIIDCSRQHLVLVRPLRTESQIIFEGEKSDETICGLSGANEIITEKEFEGRLRHIARHHAQVFTIFDTRDHGFVRNPAQTHLQSQLGRIFTDVVDCSKELTQLRSIKSPEELAAIRRAVRVTRAAFEIVRNHLEEYRYEYEIEADITRSIRRANAQHAYEPIIASGSNAVTLHYTESRDRLSKKAAVLIDVGARVDGYAADITRTYCLQPTKRQKAVHAAVENAHRKIISLLRPGLLVSEYIEKVDEIMKHALLGLKLMKDAQDVEAYHRYFPHAISHGLGIDVHDSLGAPKAFQTGMVLTVEPGIYIPEEGIGVRIEDDILITEQGHENLSRALPTSL